MRLSNRNFISFSSDVPDRAQSRRHSLPTKGHPSMQAWEKTRDFNYKSRGDVLRNYFSLGGKMTALDTWSPDHHNTACCQHC